MTLNTSTPGDRTVSRLAHAKGPVKGVSASHAAQRETSRGPLTGTAFLQLMQVTASFNSTHIKSAIFMTRRWQTQTATTQRQRRDPPSANLELADAELGLADEVVAVLSADRGSDQRSRRRTVEHRTDAAGR